MLTIEQLVELQGVVRDVFVHHAVQDYAVRLVMATRDPARWGLEDLDRLHRAGLEPARHPRPASRRLARSRCCAAAGSSSRRTCSTSRPRCCGTASPSPTTPSPRASSPTTSSARCSATCPPAHLPAAGPVHAPQTVGVRAVPDAGRRMTEGPAAGRGLGRRGRRPGAGPAPPRARDPAPAGRQRVRRPPTLAHRAGQRAGRCADVRAGRRRAAHRLEPHGAVGRRR